MAAKKIVDGVYVIPLGGVNAFLLEAQDGLVLIDTGSPGNADEILLAVNELGKQPGDIHHILLTHWHPDHMGGMAALKRATGAQTYAHPIDAPIIREGGVFDPVSGVPRPFLPAPGMEFPFRQFITGVVNVEGGEIDHEINEGDILTFLPDLKVIFAPGHSDGQVVFLWEVHGGVLFAADTCANIPMLNWSLGYENFNEGKRTLKKLAGYDFQIATFGHGDAILKDAAIEWRRKWHDKQV
ncbi:MAG: MBL fold metallo-hydrolase [Chloroflexi bacterium]|nr:MBL fold metallo-hydrolase [Chloroflexota bacterium]